MDYRLTDLARQEIEALLKDGISLTPQEILDIQRLSLDCEGAGVSDGSISRGRPADMGGEIIWPPTIAAASFYEEVSPAARDYVEGFFVFAYACRFGRDADRIYVRGKEALEAVRAWRKRLRCTNEEVVDAVEAVTADSAPTPEGCPEGKIADLALRAAALVGGTPELWETQCAIPAVARIVDIAWEQKKAEGKSAKNEPHIRATKRLGQYILELKKRKAADNG